MLSSFTIFLSLATLLSPALSVPSPRGGRIGGGGGRIGGSGGGGRIGGGGGGGSTGTGLALGYIIAADSNNGYRTYDAPAPDAGYDDSTSCDYKGGNATDTFATDPAWISSMSTCLNVLSAGDWHGTLCTPPTGGVEFGFWKGEDDYSDPGDCFKRCQGCLSSAINASQAITTKCQYEYKTHRSVVGYKTHTCTMGYNKQ